MAEQMDLDKVEKLVGAFLDIINIAGGGIGVASGHRIVLDKDTGDFYLAYDSTNGRMIVKVGTNAGDAITIEPNVLNLFAKEARHLNGYNLRNLNAHFGHMVGWNLGGTFGNPTLDYNAIVYAIAAAGGNSWAQYFIRSKDTNPALIDKVRGLAFHVSVKEDAIPAGDLGETGPVGYLMYATANAHIGFYMTVEVSGGNWVKYRFYGYNRYWSAGWAVYVTASPLYTLQFNAAGELQTDLFLSYDGGGTAKCTAGYSTYEDLTIGSDNNETAPYLYCWFSTGPGEPNLEIEVQQVDFHREWE